MSLNVGINALVLRPGEYSGVHVAVRDLINAVVNAAGAGSNFTIYSQRSLPPGLPDATPAVRYIKPFWPVGWRAGRITWEQFFLHSRVFKDNVDLLHCPAYVMPHWCIKPVVLSVHDIFALNLPQFCTAANRSHYARMMPKSIDRSRRILVPSTYVKDELLNWNDARKKPSQSLAEKITVLPWGVRFGRVDDEKRCEEVALRYGLPPKFVLVVSRPEPKKNIIQAIEAFFAATVSANLPHRLVMVGPQGWGVTKRIDKLIKDLDLGDKVVRPGFIPDEDLEVVYRLASVLVFPSLAEGFGLPVLEAMACGTPVICSDIPPLREIAGEAACLVEAGNLPLMRESLEELLTNQEMTGGLAEKGRARAAGFTWKVHAEKTLEVYREVLAEST